MDEAAIAARAGTAGRTPREGRPQPADVDAALERARAQVEALAELAAELESTLPGAGRRGRPRGHPRRGGSGRAASSPRCAGSPDQTIRRLERLESDLLAERHARVDDLGAARRPDRLRLAWRRRAARRIERKLDAGGSAQVYRIDERDREAS